jgi:hypothetical protein
MNAHQLNLLALLQKKLDAIAICNSQQAELLCRLFQLPVRSSAISSYLIARSRSVSEGDSHIFLPCASSIPFTNN